MSIQKGVLTPTRGQSGKAVWRRWILKSEQEFIRKRGTGLVGEQHFRQKGLQWQRRTCGGSRRQSAWVAVVGERWQEVLQGS